MTYDLHEHTKCDACEDEETGDQTERTFDSHDGVGPRRGVAQDAVG